MKKLRKVCFVLPDLGSGGAQRVVCNLANKFAECGCKVVLFAFHNGEANCFYKTHPSIEMFTLPSCEVRNREVDIRHNTEIMRRMLLQISPDLVIAFLMPVTMYCYYATRDTSIRIILSERNDPDTGIRYPEWAMLRNQAFYGADACVFQTQQAMQYYGDGVKNKSKVINNPVVLEMLSDFELPQAAEREKRIVNVGRYDPQKNHIMLMKAFSIFLLDHPGYKLEIYGRDFHEYSREILTERKKLHLDDSVELCGADNNLFSKIYNAKMFVLSSDYEGMPNALLESVIIGLPSISTDCPIFGSRSIIKDGINGLLTEVNNPQDLAHKMSMIANNDQFANMLSHNGRKIAANYDISKIFGEWMDLISAHTDLYI